MRKLSGVRKIFLYLDWYVSLIDIYVYQNTSNYTTKSFAKTELCISLYLNFTSLKKNKEVTKNKNQSEIN